MKEFIFGWLIIVCIIGVGVGVYLAWGEAGLKALFIIVVLSILADILGHEFL